MALQMITANRLSDGAVVYLGDDDAWSAEFKNGRAVAEGEIDALMAIAEEAEANCVIVGPYAIAVEDGPDGMQPVRFREKIRARGPTVRAGRDA